MAVPTYFTVTGTYSSFSPGVTLNGHVLIVPVMADGSSIPATGLTPTLGIVPFSVPGKIVNGVLTALDGSTLSLLANLNLGLVGELYYRVFFEDMTAVVQSSTSGAVLDVQSVALGSFSFLAPTSATVVDLISVAPLSMAWDANVSFSGGAVPASASAAGFKDQITHDTSYIYVCVAANTWKRAALSTW